MTTLFSIVGLILLFVVFGLLPAKHESCGACEEDCLTCPVDGKEEA